MRAKEIIKKLIVSQIIVLLGIVFVMPMLGLTNNSKADTKKYKIWMDSTFAPFEFQDQSGQYIGIDVDIIKKIAAIEGFEVELKYPGFEAAIQGVQSGQADGVMAACSITDERKKVLDFSDSYYAADTILGVKKSNEKNVNSYSDLAGKSVGAKIGTASHQWLQDHASEYGYTLKSFDSGDEMYNSLDIGSIYAMMDDAPVLEYAIAQGRDFVVPESIPGEKSGDYGFAVAKGKNQELLDMFNDGLKQIKENGTYQQIIDNYTGNTANTNSSKIDESTYSGLIEVNWKQLLNGLWQTIELALLSFVFGIIIALVFGVMAVSKKIIARGIVRVYVDVIRGIPLMVLVFFIFYGIPQVVGHPLDEFFAGLLALTLNASAYLTEIVRSGIQAVPKGQKEAAYALGMTKPWVMGHVILPQGIRIMMPSFINQFVISLKDTTILSVIGLIELLQTGKIIIARNFQGFKVYLIIAIMYFVVITALTKLANFLERKAKKS
ncbi:MAG: ABC transporter substrate-binding protein/permease [Candidatus Ancillula sp.]|jgi:polar amino acid transport system substrate-binding protein|nr:ABC transporter substrate-binding protein/permease [Candidatus Ancillula sp.]